MVKIKFTESEVLKNKYILDYGFDKNDLSKTNPNLKNWTILDADTMTDDQIVGLAMKTELGKAIENETCSADLVYSIRSRDYVFKRAD